MKKKILTVAAALFSVATFACTNLIMGKKASVDGSVICTYNCDGFGFGSPLSYSPAGAHAVKAQTGSRYVKVNERTVDNRDPFK